MAGRHQRRIWVLGVAAGSAVAAWLWLPGGVLDRAAFATVARCFANPPLFVSGHGRHGAPWNLRTFSTAGHAEAREAPVMVALGDDAGGFFQSSPPSPIDFAVILSNMHRLGVNKGASAVAMAWDAPDPIGLKALDQALGRFGSLVMAAPLSRGAVGEAMPVAFRRASVPMASVAGDVSSLPVVNRIPLPGLILGGENTLAGFQTLDAMPNGHHPPLLARWEDRVVFAFPLLCALQRLDLPVSGVEIHVGAFIKLGEHGPIVPIDPYGRLAVPFKALAPHAVIPAESLIDGAAGLIPPDGLEPVVLRDERSAAEPTTRAFSKNLPGLMAALASDAGLAPSRDYERLPARWELATLGLLVLALTTFCVLPIFSRRIVMLAMAAACLGVQCLAAGAAHLWLPGLPALIATLSALLVSRLIAVTPDELRPTPAAADTPPRRPAKPKPSRATPVSAPPMMSAEPPLEPATQQASAKKPRASSKKRRR